jgi:hypothetical protein
MVRTNPPNFIKKDKLVSRLAENGKGVKKDLNNLGKNELVWRAYDLGIIDDVEKEASLNRNHSTIPCYLYTYVTDPKIRSRIEEYVKAYSMLQTRGSILANLMVMNLEKPNFKRNTFPSELIQIPKFLSDENEIKKCFWPERWMNKKKIVEVDPLLSRTYMENKNDLDAFLPSDMLMVNTGWDNALNHMGTSYLGNIKTMFLTSLVPRIQKFINLRTFSPDTLKKEVAKAVLFNLRPSSEITQEDFEWALEFRNFLGIEWDKTFYSTEHLNELNDQTWTLHLWIQEVFKEDGYSKLPLMTLSRKYAYIEEKIAKNLFGKTYIEAQLEKHKGDEGSNLQKYLGLTYRAFSKKRNEVRKALRKKYKDRKKTEKAKKWKNQGHGCLRKDACIRFITTDGVGLRLGIETVPKERPLPFDHVIEIPRDALKIGQDYGRVNMTVATDEHGNTTKVKRKDYYKAQKDKRFKKWERNRMTGTPWGLALAEMSRAGGFKNSDLDTWKRTLSVMAKNIKVLKEEQVDSKERAHQRMFRFRAKKQFLDGNWKKIIGKLLKDNPAKHLVIGSGSADFASTGKGEQAVPTVEIKKALKRVISMMGAKRRVHDLPIEEDMTTQCCHRCHKKMDYLYRVRIYDGVPTLVENLRYRLCRHCTALNQNGKRRHRDVNASKNMLTLVSCFLKGDDRPESLVNPFRKEDQRSKVSLTTKFRPKESEPSIVKTAVGIQSEGSHREFPF